MKISRKIAIVSAALLVAGAVRVPLEISLTRDLRAAKLMPEPLSVGARDRIGQTSAAVALGGLRTLVATFLNLRAYTAFSEQRWADLEENFNTIVDLAPDTDYYWKTGSWHLAYNAGSYYQTDADLPALRRRELWQAYVEKGRAFLERGIRNNPHNWSMQADLGKLLSDPYKVPAFPDRTATYAAAAAAYKAAADTGEAPGFVARGYFYVLARIPGKESEARALGEDFYRKSKSNRTPTLVSLLFVLRMHADPSRDPVALAAELFPTEALAYSGLSSIWQAKENDYPVDGIAPALQALEKKLSIPWEKSVFNPALSH